MIPEFRVSQADTFRAWLEDESDDLGWILNQLTEREPTHAMLRGTALHKALEVMQEGAVCDRITVDGFTFIFDCDCELVLPRARELRMRKNYGGIYISGQIDSADGNLIIDHKSTVQFDSERYLRGYQWRFYLDIFKAQAFRWYAFEMHEERDQYRVNGRWKEDLFWRVTQVHALEQHRYPGLEEDCRRLALKLREFAAAYLQTTESEAQPWEAA